jgi:hypothetical protein
VDWDSPGAAEVASRNRELADAYRDWMAPLAETGQLRPMSIVMLGAIVAGPAHAIARRWLQGQLRGELLDYLDELVDAATAAVSRPGAGGSSRRRAIGVPKQSRIRLELVADDAVWSPKRRRLRSFRAPGRRAGRRVQARHNL